jgi:hypothetical protein
LCRLCGLRGGEYNHIKIFGGIGHSVLRMDPADV